jgi:hypothetical protein
VHTRNHLATHAFDIVHRTLAVMPCTALKQNARGLQAALKQDARGLQAALKQNARGMQAALKQNARGLQDPRCPAQPTSSLRALSLSHCCRMRL